MNSNVKNIYFYSIKYDQIKNDALINPYTFNNSQFYSLSFKNANWQFYANYPV